MESSRPDLERKDIWVASESEVLQRQELQLLLKGYH